MLNSYLWDFSDAYIYFKGSITVVGEGNTQAAWQKDRNNKQVMLKNFHHLPTL